MINFILNNLRDIFFYLIYFKFYIYIQNKIGIKINILI